MSVYAIAWINEAPGASRDEAGYWISQDRRFRISPKYRHTVYPSHYELKDTKTGARPTFDRVRDCKAEADRILDREAGSIS